MGHRASLDILWLVGYHMIVQIGRLCVTVAYMIVLIKSRKCYMRSKAFILNEIIVFFNE